MFNRPGVAGAVWLTPLISFNLIAGKGLCNLIFYLCANVNFLSGIVGPLHIKLFQQVAAKADIIQSSLNNIQSY